MSTIRTCPSDLHRSEQRPCDRCGVIRTVKNERRARTNLCRDCYGILSVDQREAWAA